MKRTETWYAPMRIYSGDFDVSELGTSRHNVELTNAHRDDVVVVPVKLSWDDDGKPAPRRGKGEGKGKA